MSDKVMITESTLDNIGEAIREKNGESDLYYPNQMPAAIRRIPTGGGGSGSVVAVFPVLLSGEHIADIVVDGDRFELYAPEPIEYEAGTGIEISQNGVVSVSEALRATIAGKVDTSSFDTAIASLVASVASKQDLLSAGDNITIRGNVISATGGTDVEANPAGTPTEELNTIRIGSDIYEIVGGGQGGNAYERTVLATPNLSVAGEITLSDDVTNYDELEIVIGFTSGNSKATFRVDAEYFRTEFPYVAGATSNDPHYLCCIYDAYYLRILMGSADNKLYAFEQNLLMVEEVAGIKHMGGGGSSLPFDVVINSNDNGIDIVYDDGT